VCDGGGESVAEPGVVRAVRGGGEGAAVARDDGLTSAVVAAPHNRGQDLGGKRFLTVDRSHRAGQWINVDSGGGAP
jgi:hypothetical protein